MIVYKITNKINGKVYIGLTCNPFKKRLKEHRFGRNTGKKSAIHLAIKKYGWDNFEKEILEKCSSKPELIERERYWIGFYKSCERGMGYNITNGGEGCRSRAGHKFTDEQRRKMSLAKMGQKNHTTPHSEKTKRIISEKKKGRITEHMKSKMKKVLCINNGITYESIESAARMLEIYPQNLLKVLKGERKSTGNLTFKLA